MEIGSFGDIVFQISDEKFLSIKNMTREKKAKWEEHTILNDLAFTEFRGRDLNTMTLDIQLVSSMGSDIEGNLSKLNNILENGEHHYLSIGGNTIGDFPYVLESISEAFSIYFDSEFKNVEVSLGLKEYRDNTKSLKQVKEERSMKNQTEMLSEGEIIDGQESIRDV